MKKVYLRKNKGITLIALVITIIVLLILAGVAIAMLSGENGILKKAAESKTKTEQAQKEEDTTLTDMETTTNFLTNNVSYKIKNGYMTGFTIGDKVSEINKELKSLGYEINLKYDFSQKKDVPIEDEEDLLIATGMSVQKDGKTIARTIVFGDLTCDGTIVARDKSMMNTILLNSGNWEAKSFQLQAADVDNNGEINEQDITCMDEYISGRDLNAVSQNQYVKVKDNELKIIYKNN